MNFSVEAPHIESPPDHVWWPLACSKWKYQVFNILHDLTEPRD